METLLMWWNVTWVQGTPVYTQPMQSEPACYEFIWSLTNALAHREVIGVYDEYAGVCRLTIAKART